MLMITKEDLSYVRLVLTYRGGGSEGISSSIEDRMHPDEFGYIILPATAARYVKLCLLAKAATRSVTIANMMRVDQDRPFTIRVTNLSTRGPVYRRAPSGGRV